MGLEPGGHCGVGPISITRSGRSGAPITIKGRPDAILDGRKTPNPTDLSHPTKPYATRQPRKSDWSYFSLIGVEYLAFDGLVVRNCWPTAIFAQDARFIILRNTSVVGSTFAFFVRDDFRRGERSHNFLVEGCRWNQDDSLDHKLWSQYDWREAHGGEGGRGTLRFFNGGFFGSGDIVGNVIFRRNRISDAYNGIVLWATEELQSVPAEMNSRNCHIDIYENRFTRVRDNPIEPEGHAFDLRIRHNAFVDCHAWFSFDGVAGGCWYVYGNTGRFETRQGGPRSNIGKVLKYASVGPFPTKPVYVLHNSWRIRCPVISGDSEAPHRTARLIFMNNAIEFCRPELDGELCRAVGFVENFDWASSQVEFDFDTSDHREFPSAINAVGQERSGRHSLEPLFVNPQSDDFSIDRDSVATGLASALQVELPDGQFVSIRARDAGAVQAGNLVSIPELEAAAGP